MLTPDVVVTPINTYGTGNNNGLLQLQQHNTGRALPAPEVIGIMACSAFNLSVLRCSACSWDVQSL